MESTNHDGNGATSSPSSSVYHLPPPPNPSADAGVIPKTQTPDTDASIPREDEAWDVDELTPGSAMKILGRSLQALIDVTGDAPPTPPISRPGTPPRPPSQQGGGGAHRRTSSRPATPVPAEDLKAPGFKTIPIDCPEAHSSEPSARDENSDAELRAQQIAIARKFFSKKAPPVSLDAYLMRLQRYCPMSTAVYLAAGVYIHKLVVEERVVPVTQRTVHRLVLASLRVAMKALEDLRYPQSRFAGVGGVSENELKFLEISVCFLTDFELQVSKEMLYRKTILLQQAADHPRPIRIGLAPTLVPLAA